MNIYEKYKSYMRGVIDSYKKLAEEEVINYSQARYLYETNEHRESYFNVARKEGFDDQINQMKEFDQYALAAFEIGEFHAE